MEINNIRYISSKELMKELDVSRQTLWRWRHEGKIPLGNRFRDRKILFTEEEADVIRGYATRVDPIDQTGGIQLRLFRRGQ